MDADVIITAIQTVGFPIIAFFLVFKTSNEQSNKWTDKIADITKSMIELTAAVKNQTELLTELMKEVRGDK